MLKMSEGIQEILIALGIACLMFAIFMLSACNPDMPKKKDYSAGMYPCYLADKCITIHGFKNAHHVDCAVAIQKCFRYTDEEKCGDDKDCRDRVGIRY